MSNPENSDRTCDVLIIGAGMAGACLARQLRLELPSLSVVVVERKKDFDWWIGESTAEVFDDYAIRNLRLGPYLAANHITKHGLRFWFDSKATNLPMDQLSEQGRTRYATLNRGVQLDRCKFDRDMCVMNQKMGVTVLMDTRVLTHSVDANHCPGFELQNESMHIVHTNRGDIHCKFLIDAGGRDAPLVQQLDLLDKEVSDRRKVGSYWARLEGCEILDDLGGETWHRRVDHTLRWASTNHFMYDGYWIWLIPINENIISIGITFDHQDYQIKIKNGDAFMKFMRTHKSIDQLFGNHATLLDFHGFKQNIRGVKQYFSENRWFLTGMAGLFVDPLFSSNAGLISVNNRMIISLIEAHLAGDPKRVANRTRHFNIAMKNIFLRQLNSFSNYHSFGSFDAFVNWQSLRFYTILNYEVAMQHADYKPMIEKIDCHDEHCGCAIGVWSESQQIGEAADRLTREFVAYLDSHDQYYARNQGYFNDKTERAETRSNTLNSDFGESRKQESLLNWESFCRYYVTRLCEFEGVCFSPQAFKEIFNPDWNAGQKLCEILEFLRTVPHPNDGTDKDSLPRWGFKGPIPLELENCNKWQHRFIGPDGKHVIYPDRW